jgi:selenocysteine-specific elongation factor
VAPESKSELRVVVGTAGHIDHGKTALVRALTGIDTDRLPEERARGITIELGFAHLDTAAGGTLAVIDVPGHERFVRAMVAGATGIDLALLVVAADEGVMPQTREHLDICQLLGLRAGLVALTKCDLVDAEWLALVTEEVRAAVAGTFLEPAAILPCSSVTGAGLPAVRAELERLAAAAGPRAVDGPMRLPLDRVFSVKGFGTVVTGTLASGRLRVGDEVLGLPGARWDGRSGGGGDAGGDAGGRRAKIRGIEVHGGARAESSAGQRTAANLHTLERDELARGMVLVHPDEMRASALIDVELAVLPGFPVALKNRAKVLFHALTTQESAVLITHEGTCIEPGARALAQLHLQRPAALLPGDRFILRGFRALPGYGTTLGGGRVVRVLAPKRRRADAGALHMLRRMAGATTPEERIALAVEAAGTTGLDRVALRARVGEGGKTIERAVERLLATRAAITFHREAGGIVAAAALARLAEPVLAELERLHAASPLAPGVAREELRSSLALTRALDPRIFQALIAELVKREAVVVEADRIRRQGFSPARAEAEQAALAERLRLLFRASGLAPPWSSELGARTGAAQADAQAALEILIRRGELVRVKPDLCFDRAAVSQLAERLRRHLTARGQITAQEWKELTGQTRKYAIPLAEHFDAEKLTLRVGEMRRLRGA